MKFKFLFLLISIASVDTFAQTKVKNGNSKKPETSAFALVGTWRLVEFSDLDTVTNTWKYRYGRNPRGYFSYSKSKIVNINISSEYPLQIPKDSSDRYTINLSKYLDTYALGYFGTYSVDIEKSIVTHHVTGGTIPDY